jgi:hypothetical protein
MGLAQPFVTNPRHPQTAEAESMPLTIRRLKQRGSHGADGRTRTGDLLITNQLLYQLSYVGAGAPVSRPGWAESDRHRFACREALSYGPRFVSRPGQAASVQTGMTERTSRPARYAPATASSSSSDTASSVTTLP